MASASNRVLRPKNLTISYQNTCGAPAPRRPQFPRTSKSQSSASASRVAATKFKLVEPKKSIRTSGDLVYTIKGPKLPPAAVSNIIPLLFTLLKVDLVVQCLQERRNSCSLQHLRCYFYMHGLHWFWFQGRWRIYFVWMPTMLPEEGQEGSLCSSPFTYFINNI